jgi:hypothetical protein
MAGATGVLLRAQQQLRLVHGQPPLRQGGLCGQVRLLLVPGWLLVQVEVLLELA